MSDRLLGAACIAVAAAMAWAAKGYAAEISYEPVGPRAFPLLLSGLMALGGLWLIVKPGPGGAGVGMAQLKGLGWSVVAVFVYALLFEKLGFPLATTLMAIPLGMAFGGRWWHCALGGAGLGLVFYVLFDRLLDVVLPAGVLGVLFGAR